MLAKITNFGRPRTFPTYKGYVFLPEYEPYKTQDKKIVETLKKYNKRDDIFLKIDILEDEPAIDYSKYKIYELRSIAAKVGIEGFFTMKKLDLIKNLEDKNGISQN